MNKINKAMADACGIKLRGHEYIIYESEAGDKIYAEWTINDPRCRQIIREKFRLTTKWFGTDWFCFKFESQSEFASLNGKGKTIAEAEVSCIKEIYRSLTNEEK